MTARRQKQLKDETSSTESNSAPLLDMTARRQEAISEERRKVRRTILAEFVAAYVLIPEKGLQKVSIYDISEDGLAMDLESQIGHFRQGEEFAMRLYLSKDTYLPFIVRVRNVREITDEEVHRHGVQFIKDSMNSEAFSHFVMFMKTVSASLQTDRGDILVSNIK